MEIAIYGAKCSGKTTLVADLKLHLNSTIHVSERRVLDAHPLHAFEDDVALLCGLDLPVVPLAVHAEDSKIRFALESARINYHVVYGVGAVRWQNALQAIASVSGQNPKRNNANFIESGRYQGLCEKCSDPECEHRIFTQLLKR